jgi:hypothetical protein
MWDFRKKSKKLQAADFTKGQGLNLKHSYRIIQKTFLLE